MIRVCWHDLSGFNWSQLTNCENYHSDKYSNWAQIILNPIDQACNYRHTGLRFIQGMAGLRVSLASSFFHHKLKRLEKFRFFRRTTKIWISLLLDLTFKTFKSSGRFCQICGFLAKPELWQAQGTASHFKVVTRLKCQKIIPSILMWNLI